MAAPEPGIGFDIRLPYSRDVRLFIALEGYLNGTSHVRLGVELNRFPFIRLEGVPNPSVVVRPSPIQVSDLKFLVCGITTNQWQPVVELVHRYTLLGSIIDPKQRDTIASVADTLRLSLPAAMSSLKSNGALPPLDFRRPNMHGSEEMKERLRQTMSRFLQERALRNDDPLQGNPNLTHMLADLFKKDGLRYFPPPLPNSNRTQQQQQQQPPQTWPGLPKERQDREDLKAVRDAAKVHQAEPRRGPTVLGQMRRGPDGRLHLVTPGPSEEERQEAREVNEVVSQLKDENPLVLFGRRLMMQVQSLRKK